VVTAHNNFDRQALTTGLEDDHLAGAGNRQMQTGSLESPSSQVFSRAQEPARSATGGRDTLVLTVFVLLASSLLIGSITGGTLWIDEGFSAWLASHRTFSAMVDTLRNSDGSDLQTPLYYAFLWFWAQLWGHTEYALRAANAPFALLFCLALALASWRIWGRTVAWVVACFSPFVWTYIDESRPYFLMMACAAASTSALLIYAFSPRPASGKHNASWAPWLCLIFLFSATAADVLALFLVPALVALAAFGMHNSDVRMWWRDWRRPLFALSPFFIVLGIYYSWTMRHGTDYALVPFSAGHLGLMGYEFFGFGGLGPGRNVLRLPHVEQALLQSWPWLLGGTVGLISAFTAATRRLPDQRSLLALTTALTVSILFVVACGLMLHARFLPRHAAALHPLILFIFLALLGRRSSQESNRLDSKIAAATFCLAITWIVSDVRLRSLPEYRKEDYRQAASIAAADARRLNGDIAWCADIVTGSYYGLDLSEYSKNTTNGRFWLSGREVRQQVSWPVQRPAFHAENWGPSIVQTFISQRREVGTPVILVISKPDLYDKHRAWRSLIASSGVNPEREPDGFQVYIFR
jgi:hypothetical protein